VWFDTRTFWGSRWPVNTERDFWLQPSINLGFLGFQKGVESREGFLRLWFLFWPM
jgi:hypothetical protein